VSQRPRPEGVHTVEARIGYNPVGGPFKETDPSRGLDWGLLEGPTPELSLRQGEVPLHLSAGFSELLRRQDDRLGRAPPNANRRLQWGPWPRTTPDRSRIRPFARNPPDAEQLTTAHPHFRCELRIPDATRLDHTIRTAGRTATAQIKIGPGRPGFRHPAGAPDRSQQRKLNRPSRLPQDAEKAYVFASTHIGELPHGRPGPPRPGRICDRPAVTLPTRWSVCHIGLQLHLPAWGSRPAPLGPPRPDPLPTDPIAMRPTECLSAAKDAVANVARGVRRPVQQNEEQDIQSH